jgi:hypothetical protein
MFIDTADVYGEADAPGRGGEQLPCNPNIGRSDRRNQQKVIRL